MYLKVGIPCEEDLFTTIIANDAKKYFSQAPPKLF